MKATKILAVLAAAVTAAALTLSVSAAYLPAPTVSAAAVSDTSVSLSWSRVSGAEKYSIYMFKPHAANYAKIGTVASTSVSIDKLNEGTL